MGESSETAKRRRAAKEGSKKRALVMDTAWIWRIRGIVLGFLRRESRVLGRSVEEEEEIMTLLARSLNGRFR